MKSVRPKFERPPIIEQAISIGFDTLAHFTVGHFGLFWERVKKDLTECSSQPVLQAVIEEEEPFVARQTQIQLLSSEALPRAFFSRADGSEIVQLQNDRFAYNWSAVAGDTYPSFESTIERFRHYFGQLQMFVHESLNDELHINQCELTNVNIIPTADTGDDYASASRFLPELAGDALDDDVQFEGAAHRSSYRLEDGDKFIGRLQSSMGPARRIADNAPVIRFEISVKGFPRASTIEDLVAFFERARSAINAAFLRETTNEAKQFWGMK